MSYDKPVGAQANPVTWANPVTQPNMGGGGVTIFENHGLSLHCGPWTAAAGAAPETPSKSKSTSPTPDLLNQRLWR